MISVIVPVYNVERYLKRCVDSIINQTYSDLEIILVDDGSTDSSGYLCDEIKKTNTRIKVIHKANGGLSSARNAGLEIATGSYIGFVDSDDWIATDMYESLIVAIKETESDVAITGINRIYDNGYCKKQFIKEKTEIYQGADIIEEYLKQNSFSTAAWDKLYKKKLFEKRRFPEGKLYEDAPIIYDILKNVTNICCIGKPHYYYFQRSDSICGLAFSSRKMDHYNFSYDIFCDVQQCYPQLSDFAKIFWGCKVNEIIYALYESSNREKFNNERVMLQNEINSYWKVVMHANSVPKLIKLKICLARFRLIPIYINIKKILVKKG